METTYETVEQPQFLTFQIAGDEYAIGILKVREIIQYDDITRVPRTPEWIRGVINLRGSVVPVVDLSVKFGMEAGEVTTSTCIIITEMIADGDSIVIGVIADAVSQVIELGPDQIETPPAFGTKVDLEYLVGMGKSGNKFVLILDIDRVLSVTEIAEATSLDDTDDAGEDAAGASDIEPVSGVDEEAALVAAETA